MPIENDLNSGQQIAYDGISDTNLALLTAKGGCGKSYLTAKIIIDKARAGHRITVVAPSHTARSVIEQEIQTQTDDIMWDGLRDKVVTMTAAAALGKRPDMSKRPKNYKDTPFITDEKAMRLLENTSSNLDKKQHLLIIEEISMISKADLIKMLDTWGNKPTLMVGDFRQIPPVNAEGSHGYLGKLYKANKLKHFKLTENMRSASDTQIAEYADAVYEAGGHIDGNYSGVTILNDTTKFNEVFCEKVKGELSCTAIAYRNRTVNSFMELASGGDDVDIKSGDLIRLHESITVSYKDDEGKWQKEIVANNGDIIKVIDYSDNNNCYNNPHLDDVIHYGTITLDLPNPAVDTFQPYVTLKIPNKISNSSNAGKKGEYGTLFGKLLQKITAASKELEKYEIGGEYGPITTELLNNSGRLIAIFDKYDSWYSKDKERNIKAKINLLWGSEFYGERSLFTNATRLYSLTAHKSQGQSIDIVFANLKDIASAKENEVKHLSYVACSRAKKELYVLI